MPATMDIDALLVHGPFLRRLAHSLLDDAAAADDVLQQTWLTALEKRPRDPGALRGWLASITRNLAREGGRRNARRRAWEAGAARPEALPDTQEIVERESVRRQVVEAVLALDEPYRSAILLRFYEELPPRRIAERLGVPVETVRTRLKRGLAQLGRRLDGAHGGDRRRWVAGLIPLALANEAAAATPLLLLPGLSVLGPGAQMAAGALLMLGLAAGAVWWLARDDAPPQQPASARVSSDEPPLRLAAAPVAPAEVSAPPVLEALPSPEPAASEPLPVLSLPIVAGRLLAMQGGEPWPHAEMLVAGVALEDMGLLASAGRDELAERWEQQSVTTDAEGRFRLGGLEPGVWMLASGAGPGRPFAAAGVVLVDVPDLAVVIAADMVRRRCEEVGLEPPAFHRLSSDGVLQLDVIAERVPTRSVSIVDPAGHGLPGAELVSLSPTARLAMEAAPYEDFTWARLEPVLEQQVADEQGLVSEVAVQPGSLLLASAPGHQTRRFTLPDDAPVPAGIRIELEPAVTVTVAGRVLDESGVPIANADVAISEFGMHLAGAAQFEQTMRRQGARRTRSDGSGQFEFEAVDRLSLDRWTPRPLAERSSFSVTAIADGTLSETSSLQASSDGPRHEVELTLKRGGPLEITVIDRATLEPVVNLPVAATQARNTSTRWTDEDGTAQFDGHAHGALGLILRRPGFEPVEAPLPDWRGEPVELLLAFEPVSWTLDVDVTDRSGRPLGPRLPSAGGEELNLYVLAYPADPTPLYRSPLADRGLGGRSAWPGRWEEGAARIAFERSWTADEAWVAVVCEQQLLALEHAPRGLEHLTLVADGDYLDGRGVTLTVTVGQADGYVTFFGTPGWLRDPESGRNVSRLDWHLFSQDLSGVAPHAGRYDLQLRNGFGAAFMVRGIELGDDDTELHVEVPGQAVLTVSVQDGAGVAAPAQLVLFDDLGTPLWSAKTFDGTARITINPGDGVLHLLATGASGLAELPITLQPGDQERRVLQLLPTASVTLRVPGRSAAQLEGALLRVLDSQDRPVWHGLVDAAQAGQLAGEGWTLPVLPGRVTAMLGGLGLPFVERRAVLEPEAAVVVTLD